MHTGIRAVCLLALTALAINSASAQSVPHFLHHPLGHPLHNPAVIMWQARSATLQLLHRSQWTAYNSTYDAASSPPTTQQIQLLLPFSQPRVGLGFTFTQDAIGPLMQQFLQLAIGYSIQLDKVSILSFGLSPLYRRNSVDRNSYRALDNNDPLISAASSSQSLDFSAGVMYTYLGLRTGFSALQLRASGLTTLGREYVFFSAYDFALYDRRRSTSKPLWLRPGLMLRTGYDLQLDTSLLLHYNDRLWGGLLWRNQGAAALLFGLQLLKNSALSVGYGFELITTEAVLNRGTSHEAMLRYAPRILSSAPKKPVYTPRFPF